MTRTEMIEKLSSVKFEFIDPPSEWRDIGFTERPIWVNSNGYGYVSCDEHIECGECEGLTNADWSKIKSKLDKFSLTITDIEKTSLFKIIEDGPLDYLLDYKGHEDETEVVNSTFLNLKDISIEAPTHIWWMEDPNNSFLHFFSTKDSFIKAYMRDWCDYFWTDLDDRLLEEWTKRLF